ncbi:hypothetical protein JWJ90_09390 [Desulfobulbus rhabdoformis]|uniref:hypothetical protein n=1 Tax=Desulfobulbus rhabdoformis TaxID=34032 RepID=UPI001965F9B0|nr:hypothetical protein [Desulfobulbus rhabdoformis]MBM9614503.1 hypothetical protein [Desulfobulbus rhabdoformis]
MGQIQAVITGDVNGSSKLNAQTARSLVGVLQQCYEITAKRLPQAQLAGFTPFRGDAFQFLVGQPTLAPRSALLFRALLIFHGAQEIHQKLQAGVAIGFGSVDFAPDDLSAAGGGQAYTRSGKRLDKLRRRIPGMGVSGLGKADAYLDSLLGLTDTLIHKWTALQARAVSYALLGYSQGEIGKVWAPPISQQAVNKHLRAAGWPGIEPALHWAETFIESHIQVQSNSTKGSPAR